jgi:hypothetical protein
LCIDLFRIASGFAFAGDSCDISTPLGIASRYVELKARLQPCKALHKTINVKKNLKVMNTDVKLLVSNIKHYIKEVINKKNENNYFRF